MKYFFLFVYLIIFNNYVYARDLFQTSFYNVEFISKNIDNDKINEIKKIKIKSIQSIFQKTLNDQHFNAVNILITEDFTNAFIKNIIINDEKIINNKYLSKIKINFNKKKIINFYRKNNFPYVEFYPDKFLLIIYEKNELNENLFTNKNIFYKYLNDNAQSNTFFKIPNMDINDRFILTKNHIENRNFDKINSFSQKYNLSETIVVVTKKKNNEINYELLLKSDEEILEKRINFNSIQLDKFFTSLKDETLKIWKQINQIQNNSLNLLNCEVKYFNMLELKEIRNNFNNISIIKDININSISYKNINYDIYYYGNLKILFKIFEFNNLKINFDKNFCSIKLI